MRATAIYHITHLRNLPSILQEGGLCCDNTVAERTLTPTEIGYQHIKERRTSKPVLLAPGGTLADYVPLYFAPRSPMLYAIAKGLVAGYDEGQEPVLHLVTTAEYIERQNLAFVFTDGHAVMAFSTFFNNLESLDHIDWDIMKARYWMDTLEDNDRKRRRQAEFLVHDFLPWFLIDEIGVMTNRVKQKVIAVLDSAEHQPKVTVRRNWYY